VAVGRAVRVGVGVRVAGAVAIAVGVSVGVGVALALRERLPRSKKNKSAKTTMLAPTAASVRCRRLVVLPSLDNVMVPSGLNSFLLGNGRLAGLTIDSPNIASAISGTVLKR
jgi:hypothetical protein